MRYGVPKNKFNIDNFYYICLPYEYVSFDGSKKTKAESDFSDKLVELYLYLYNDKDGNLVADNYIPRDDESALMDQIVQIKGEELWRRLNLYKLKNTIKRQNQRFLIV